MSEVNPAGTVFVVLIGELLDLVKNPNISRVNVVIGSYELDDKGQQKMVDGKNSVTLRIFDIAGIDDDTREKLRAEIDGGPISHVMILWIDRSKGVGVSRFDPVTHRASGGVSDFDNVEKMIFSGYLQRQTGK